MSLDTSYEELFLEIEDYGIECESLWHEKYDWDSELAVAALNSLCHNCLKHHHILIGQRCLTQLNAKDSKEFKCLNCQKAGYITYQYTWI